MADGTLIFNTDLDTSGLSTGLGKIGSVAGTAFKGVAVAVGAAATGIGVLTKSALDGYASYEQLTGGVETLFKKSADTVMGYAENAYKTAGMSANQYMETVTSFSASLIQSLDGDTAKAAKMADMAITDMSDNANKMGTNISMIQNAYQGFAKQNYTMLDNLKLGYGGTQAEMARLLEDAAKLDKEFAKTADFSWDGKTLIAGFNDITQAIHIVQTNMGITGTTAKEAASTIEGSTASMKAAWDNLVVGIADDNADLDSLITQFIDSAATMLGNILPRIEIILTGIGQLIEEMVPVIMEQLPSLIDGVLPQLIESGISMVDSIINGILDNLPALIDMAIDLVMQLVSVLIDNAPKLIEAALQMVVQLAMGIAEALPQLIPTLVNTVLMIVETLIDNIDMLIDAAIAIIMALADGLIGALPQLIDKIPVIIDKLVMAIVNNLPKIIEMGIELIIKLAVGLIKAIPQLISKIPQIISSLINGFKTYLGKIGEVGKGIVEGIWKGISDGFTWIKNKISGWVGNVLDFFKNILGIHSPSTEFALIGKMCVAGFDEGIEPLMDGSEITRSINASVRTLGVNTAYGTSQRAGGINQTININKEVGTPDEMARAIRLESKYGLMKGVAFA